MIFFRNNISGIVGAEPDIDCVPNILPFGMVIHFLRLNGHPGHKGKSLTEISEFELAMEFV